MKDKGIIEKLKLNPFSTSFADVRDKEEIVNKLMAIKNSQGVSKEEIDFQNNTFGYVSDDDVNYIDFLPLFENKRARISKYREMSLYPEIMDALENIINDAIVDNGDGKIVDLILSHDKMPVNIKKRIFAAFDYYMDSVLNFTERGDEYFKKWLIEGELYVEQILNDAGDNIIGVKILPAFTMAPMYKNGQLAGYVQKPDIQIRNTNVDNENKDFEPNQIAYSNYGYYGENELDIRGFLESSVKTYNQLKSLEDSIIIYRLTRSTERRVWNIYTGRMPKGKAEEFVKGTIKRYRTKNLYDPNSGTVDATQNIQTMSHDIWFSKDDSGNGTTVDTIGGGMNLGEITDLDWFREKLYKSLKLPTSRWITDQKQGPYSSGKMGEVTREEIKFARFIEKLQRKFKLFILNPFLTLLRLRKIDEQYIRKEFFDLKFKESNLFKEYKEIELREARLGTLSSVAGFIVSRDNINQPEGLFSKEFVLKKYFKMTDEEYEENQKLIENELEKAQEIATKFPPINQFETEDNVDQEEVDQSQQDDVQDGEQEDFVDDETQQDDEQDEFLDDK
jgi:hypothetical protein